MNDLERRFAKLGTDHAPGQEVRLRDRATDTGLRGAELPGVAVDFSHGDVNPSAFAPTPRAFEAFTEGVERGGSQAYTEYRGAAEIRDELAHKLAQFTGRPVSASRELIVTPGTQGALFLALASTVAAGDRVAVVQPDYFANRKLVEYLGAEVAPIELDYLAHTDRAGLDLGQLEGAFEAGVRTLVFSNPNNPTGVIFAAEEIERIAALAGRYGVTVIVDQLYSRLLYSGHTFTHLRAAGIEADKVVTIMGPSKTESLSGYRLGVAFGAEQVIDRMEKLQAIVSLRAPGYSQAVLRTWFDEPRGWLADRIAKHEAIRDDLVALFSAVPGLAVRASEAGSYLFPKLPPLELSPHAFVAALREQAGVIVTPGTEFSLHAADGIRLNFSQNHQAAVAAVQRAVQLIERYRAPETEGVR